MPAHGSLPTASDAPLTIVLDGQWRPVLPCLAFARIPGPAGPSTPYLANRRLPGRATTCGQDAIFAWLKMRTAYDDADRCHRGWDKSGLACVHRRRRPRAAMSSLVGAYRQLDLVSRQLLARAASWTPDPRSAPDQPGIDLLQTHGAGQGRAATRLYRRPWVTGRDRSGHVGREHRLASVILPCRSCLFSIKSTVVAALQAERCEVGSPCGPPPHLVPSSS